MTAPQYPNQLNEPDLPPLVPVKRAGSSTNRFVRPVVALLVVGALGFGGGFVVAKATTPAASTDGGNVQFPGGFGGGPGASPGAGRLRNGFGGGASGTVASVSAGQLTLTTASGGQRLVLLTPTTTVTEITSATKSLSDIANGTQVTIVGAANPDGSVTATQVIIGNAGILGQGFGGGDVPAPSSAP
jgi:hypothetical protein